MTRPNFFIVGAPKCGTTAMDEYLKQHPDIFMAEKEMQYFGTDIFSEKKMSLDKYLMAFEKAENQKIIGESSVTYLNSKDALQGIKDFSPNAKILIMLRDPVEMIQSLHSQLLFEGHESEKDFEKSLAKDIANKKKGISTTSIGNFIVPHYFDISSYYRQVKNAIDLFGKENIQIIIYEDFIHDIDKTMITVFSFLQVDSKVQVNPTIVNPNRKIHNYFLHRIMRKPSLLLRKIVRLVLPNKHLRHNIMAYLLKRNISYVKRKPLKKELITRLYKYYENDILSLEKLAGLDLSKWKKIN